MRNLHADRVFFYMILALATILTLWLVGEYLGAALLAATAAVIVYPIHKRILRLTGQRKGPATGITLAITMLLIVIPVLIGAWLFLNELGNVSDDFVNVLRDNEDGLRLRVTQIEQWLESGPLGDTLSLAAEEITVTVREFATNIGRASANWLVAATGSVVNIVLPVVVFMSVLGALLTNGERTVQLLKDLSPLDDSIDQLFFDRLRSITRSMMWSIVVVAVVQGMVTGLLMVMGGASHVGGLTLLAMLLAILPGGAAFVAVPVGIVEILAGNIGGGALIIIGTTIVVAPLANQVRPRLVSKDVFLNRAFMLMCVFGGLVVFGALGVIYGPMIMILFTTVIEVYLEYFRAESPSVSVAAKRQGPDTEVVLATE